LGGDEFESFRGKKFPFGRETLLPPVDKLVFLFPFFFYFKTCFDSPFDLIFFSPPEKPEMGGHCVVILKLTDEFGIQGTRL
jgi:hypothetical protein